MILIILDVHHYVFIMDYSLKKVLESILQENITTSSANTIKTDSGKGYFLKTGNRSKTYLCEANGLKELAKANSIKVTQVITVGDNYILTEYIRRNSPYSTFYEIFGKQFAQLHKYQSGSYGFYEDNFIGLNPQPNIPTENEETDWIAFYFNKRLLYQYKMAEKNGYATTSLQSGFKKLESRITNILKDSIEPPTLLHGDLWSGNYLCNDENTPVLIDPAVYYGHREADMAMTKLFGGFPPEFYDSYNREYPLKEGWEYREGLYKLYHVLNHLNIFGRGYLPEAECLVREYII